jgi:hypothetical protein
MRKTPAIRKNYFPCAQRESAYLLSQPADDQTGGEWYSQENQNLHEVSQGNGQELIVRNKRFFSVDPAIERGFYFIKPGLSTFS